ncbi:MAG: electron transfer flavoprotein subunit alpha/FixB family protein [Planctomycetota bacterium]
MTKDIFVFVEQRGGGVLQAGLQAISAAAQLAAKTGGKVVAGMIGHDLATAAQRIDGTGASAAYVCDAEPLKNYNALKYARVLSGMIQKADPQIVLLAASFMGRDLAPRVAMRLEAGLATDCTEVDLEGGALIVKRPIYNGKAFSRVHFSSGRIQMASVRPNTFPMPTGGGAAERIAFSFTSDTVDDRQTTKEIVRTGGEEKDVTEASIVVSGGRSLKSEANFKIMYDLAHSLDAAVGASRAACDAGYQPHSRQVGLTGKTVTPQLYVACGISGAIQHLAGMRGSRRIVAVNTDAEAPIFKVADIGVVGDLFTFVPLLTEEVKKMKGH